MTDNCSPYLAAPVMSAERRALRLVAGYLERIKQGAEAAIEEIEDGADGFALVRGIRDRAERALQDIRALVPDAGETER